VEKMFFNKGSISYLILLGTAGKQVFFPEKMLYKFLFFHTNMFFGIKNGLPAILTTIVKLPI